MEPLDHASVPPAAPPTGPTAPPFVQAVAASLVTCVACGYDLSGTALGGNCPECGANVAHTLRRFQNAPQVTSGFAIASFVCGLLSLPFSMCVPFGFLGVVAIVLYFPAMKAVASGRAGGATRGFAIAGLVTGLISTLLNCSCLGLMIIGEISGW